MFNESRASYSAANDAAKALAGCPEPPIRVHASGFTRKYLLGLFTIHAFGIKSSLPTSADNIEMVPLPAEVSGAKSAGNAKEKKAALADEQVKSRDMGVQAWESL